MFENEELMLAQLKEQFYDVMYKYRLGFTQEGVLVNLRMWRMGKSSLLQLLRRHPNWDERELAIVFRFSEERRIDHNIVDEAKFEMMELARTCGLSSEEYVSFGAALDAATVDYKRVPEEDRLPTIRKYGGIDCAPGQKASRIINKLCIKFGLDRYVTEKEEQNEEGEMTIKTIYPYNAVFARLADSLNPVQVPKTGVLSIHPCDFLEMSNKDDTWHSCHCLADGGWRTGCQSYMGDNVSMIFFTVDDSVTSDFHKAPRITREIFCYNGGVLLQSRLYPTDNAEQRELYRAVVQQAVAECLGQPNLWRMNNKQNEIQKYWSTDENSLHYRDYDNGYAVINLLKSREGEYGHLNIGAPSYCPVCGCLNEDTDRIKCRECREVVVCKQCGQEIQKHKAQYMDGTFFCESCRPICDKCKQPISGQIHSVFDFKKQPMHLCAACYEQATAPCRTCGVHSICQPLSAFRFCPRGEILEETLEEVAEETTRGEATAEAA